MTSEQLACIYCSRPDGPMVAAGRDLFGTQMFRCRDRAACAGRLIDQVAGRIIARSLEGGAMRHVLVGAVMAGERFEDEVDVERFLDAHTGLVALGGRQAR